MENMNNSGDRQEQDFPFKIFVPRSINSSVSRTSDSPSSSSSRMMKDGDSVVGSLSSYGLSSPRIDFTPPFSAGEDRGAFNFDFTSLRGSSPDNVFNTDPLTSVMRGYSGDPNKPKRLHVSNIPFRYREHNLVMLFGRFGNVEDAEIIYNDKGSKGFGFVTMSRGQDADNALLRLNHAVVEGRIIEVNLATPKVNTNRQVPGAGVSGQVQLASSQALVEAEAKLAQAKLEVLKLRKQMQMSNYYKAAETGPIFREFPNFS